MPGEPPPGRPCREVGCLDAQGPVLTDAIDPMPSPVAQSRTRSTWDFVVAPVPMMDSLHILLLGSRTHYGSFDDPHPVTWGETGY